MIKIILLLIILLLFYLFFKIFKNEKFTNVKILSDFYLQNNQINLNNKSINANRICIFKRIDDPDNPTKKKIDYECIDSSQLLSTLNMTEGRKKLVCVDGNCLNKNDLKLLNGSEAFKLKSNSEDSFFGKKCLAETANVKLRRCGYGLKLSWLPQFVGNWWNKMRITSLSFIDCNNSSAKNLRLIVGNNSDKNLKRNNAIDIDYDEDAMPRKITINEGH